MGQPTAWVWSPDPLELYTPGGRKVDRESQPYAEVDVSRRPLIVVRVVGPLTKVGFATYLSELERAIGANGRVALRVHGGSLGIFPPSYVRESAEWLRTHDTLFTRNVTGAAFILDSPVLRMALRAILWAIPAPFPMVAFASQREADAWLAGCLSATA